MIRFTSLFILLLGTCALAAQCETDCPDDQEVIFLTNQTDSAVAAQPPGSDCTDDLFFTVRGPRSEAGLGVPDDIRLLIGTTTIAYAYTNSRFGSFTDSLTYLPDGDGTMYEADFAVNSYGTEETVGEAGGLARICLMIEHSYVGDLDIDLRCPNGQTVALLDYDNNDGLERQLLGEGNAETETPDELGLYCWTVDAPRTMAQYVSDFNVATNESLPTIDYAPNGDLAGLDACTINGDWTIVVTDNIFRDQGYMGSAFVDFGTDNLTECSYQIEATFTSSTASLARDITSLSASPNPTANLTSFTVQSRSASNGTVAIYAMDGRRIYQRSMALTAGQNSIDLTTADWPIGVYIARIRTAVGERSVRIVKQ